MLKFVFPPIVLVCASLPASARLGSFEEVEDGYGDFLNPVQLRNSGEYGTAIGVVGTKTNIPANTGLWTKIQGGPDFGGGGLSAAYATGHFGRDRLNYGDNTKNALVITTNSEGWAQQAQRFAYDIQPHDLLGINPTNTDNSVVHLTFWTCPTIDANTGSNYVGDTTSFYDSSGNLGFEIGHVQPGTTTDYVAYNLNGTWVNTNIASTGSYYQQWDVILDLGNDTVTVDWVDGGYQLLNTGATKGTGTRTRILTDAPLLNDMNDFSQLQFQSTSGVTNSKQWSLDDFEFSVSQSVPEPSAALMGLFALPLLSLRRRRN